ncbi:MAG: hypothetical protein LBI55_04275 [Oscillospiraceae bacterium]|jgi:hypothetical protein|nr:hypothetical protein [Oscillospiraceae bacterium]
MDKNKREETEDLQGISGGQNSFSNINNAPRDDVFAFSTSRRNFDGALTCRACGATIPDGAIVHKCMRDGLVYNTYRINPDKTIWRKD